jgi:phenylpyruvate tautomerase PptA (4-oxalocrotonate tautomerase family)
MPFVRIDIQSGKTTAYKRAILHGVRDGLANALGVDHDRIVQRIIESPAENIDATDVKSDRLTLIEISMLPGRGPELKERLYHEVARQLAHDPGIEEHDLVVLVNDPPAECFFMNGRMQSGGSGSPTSGGSGGGAR